MNIDFATYQPEKFKKLLVSFHSYVGAILAPEGADNELRDRIKEQKNNSDQPDKIGLAEEKQLWLQFFPGAGGNTTRAKIDYVKERLAKSRSLRDFLFTEETAERRRKAVSEFLNLIPREQYRINRIKEGHFTLEPKIDNDRLSRLMMVPSGGPLNPNASLGNVELTDKKGQANAAKPSTNQAPPSIFGGSYSKVDFGSSTTSTSQAEATVTDTNVSSVPTTEAELISREIKRNEIKPPKEEIKNTVTSNELKQPKEKPAPTRAGGQRQVKKDDQKDKNPKKKATKNSTKKRAGVIAAATLGTGAISGLPLIINMLT